VVVVNAGLDDLENIDKNETVRNDAGNTSMKLVDLVSSLPLAKLSSKQKLKVMKNFSIV
jgi:hypothetical protein